MSYTEMEKLLTEMNSTETMKEVSNRSGGKKPETIWKKSIRNN